MYLAKLWAHFGTICMLLGKFSLLWMAKYWKTNLAIWSHWPQWLWMLFHVGLNFVQFIVLLNWGKRSSEIFWINFLEPQLPGNRVLTQFFLSPLNIYSAHNLKVVVSVSSKNSPNVYKSCPKMISLKKLNILATWQKLHQNVGDLDKLIAAKGFEKLPKVQ